MHIKDRRMLWHLQNCSTLVVFLEGPWETVSKACPSNCVGVPLHSTEGDGRWE